MSNPNYKAKIRKKNFKKNLKIAFTRTCKQILTIDAMRYIVGYVRRIYYLKLLGRMKVYKNPTKDVNEHTVSHNLKNKLSDVAVIRSNMLIKPLSILFPIYSRLEDVKVLSIGPRTEGEILNLIAHGFSSKNVRGLDLMSYSPWIDVGDMHNMSYADNSFDLAISGFVLSYSDNEKKAAQEMLRVVKNGGLIAVGISYNNPEFINKVKSLRGYEIEENLLCVQDILNLFGDAVDQVYLSQDVTTKGKVEGQNLLTVFSIKK